MKDFDYIYIRAWGQMMGSFPYYIENQVSLARHAGAPENAIYQNMVGEWVTYDEITNEDAKAQVDRIIAAWGSQ